MWRWLKGWWRKPERVAMQSSAPKLDEVLRVVREQVLSQATQEGGPDPDQVIELVVRADGDPLLRRVLVTKGYELRIVIRMSMADVLITMDDQPDTTVSEKEANNQQRNGDYAHESNKNPWG